MVKFISSNNNLEMEQYEWRYISEENIKFIIFIYINYIFLSMQNNK